MSLSLFDQCSAIKAFLVQKCTTAMWRSMTQFVDYEKRNNEATKIGEKFGRQTSDASPPFPPPQVIIFSEKGSFAEFSGHNSDISS